MTELAVQSRQYSATIGNDRQRALALSAASSGYILYFPQIVAEFFLIYDEERRWQLVCFHICGSRKDLEKGEFKQ